MRQYLLTASFLLSLGLAACADHSGAIASIDPTPQPPIGPSDGNTVGGPSDQPSTVPGGGDGFSNGGSGGGSKPGGGGKPGGGTPGGSPVPEPGTMLLVGTGLAGAALMRRRRQLKVETE